MFSFLHVNPEIVIEIPGNEVLMNEIKDFSPPDLVAYYRSDTINGHVTITPPQGKKVSHKSILLTVFGEFRGDTTNKEVYERFYQRIQVLMPAGDLINELSTDFTFENINLPTNTYYGTAINALYGVEVRIVHRVSDFVVEKQFIGLSYSTYPLKTTIHNEVGIKNILHVEFIFPRQAYDAREPIVGAACFILVKLRIVFMRINVFRSEVFSSETSFFKKKTLLKTYDILDGAPVKGDFIPIRVFMADADIWPFVNFKGSSLEVEHYLRVEMIDENGKKYYKKMKVYFNRFKKEDIEKLNQQPSIDEGYGKESNENIESNEKTPDNN